MLEDYYGIAVGELSMAPSEFWLTTPAEINIASEYSYRNKMAHYDNISLAHYMAQAKAMSGKKWEPIFTKAEQKQEKAKTRVSKEQKAQELDYLKGLFNK